MPNDKLPETIFIEPTSATSGGGPPQDRFADVANLGIDRLVQRPVELAKEALGNSLGVLRVLADAVQKNFDGYDAKGKEMSAEVKVGLEFSSDLNAWVVKGNGKGTLEVTITFPLSQTK